MKKYLMAAVALICMTMTSAALLSCGDDDDDKGNDGSQFSTAVFDFTLITSDETLAVFDVIAEYYDANGKVLNEKLTQSTFKKTVKANLPAYLGARLLFNVKSGVDVASLEKVSATYGFEYSAWCENAKGGTGGITMKNDQKHVSMSGDKVENWLSKNSSLVNFGFDFTADGKVVYTGWK